MATRIQAKTTTTHNRPTSLTHGPEWGARTPTVVVGESKFPAECYIHDWPAEMFIASLAVMSHEEREVLRENCNSCNGDV